MIVESSLKLICPHNVCVSGHRIQDFSLREHLLGPFAKDTVKATFEKYPSNEAVMFHDGLATGWDMVCAEACIDLCVPFTAHIPFYGQELRWPSELQDRYRLILSKAANKIYLFDQEPRDESHARQLLFKRNMSMSDAAPLDALVNWCGRERGGTWNFIKYHRDQKKRPMVNVWPVWQRLIL